MKFLHLLLGSAAGGLARYLLASSVYRVAGAGFPYGTLAVNLAGCFLLGLLAGLAEDKLLLGPDARLLLMIGFCGAFTTFSTFIFETDNLLREGEWLAALLNVTVSVFLGFALFRGGRMLIDLV
ncbi:MAG: fluoride efflux transporter CrcB [candidate division FCPU426 bacterium]